MPAVEVRSLTFARSEHAPKADRVYTRSQLVDQIMAHNATATEPFLATFTNDELETYLLHLLSAQRPRGRDAVWQRPGDAPAIWAARTVA